MHVRAARCGCIASCVFFRVVHPVFSSVWQNALFKILLVIKIVPGRRGNFDVALANKVVAMLPSCTSYCYANLQKSHKLEQYEVYDNSSWIFSNKK